MLKKLIVRAVKKRIGDVWVSFTFHVMFYPGTCKNEITKEYRVMVAGENTPTIKGKSFFDCFRQILKGALDANEL